MTPPTPPTMQQVEEIRARHANSLKSRTVPGDLEAARRTEQILRADRATLLQYIDALPAGDGWRPIAEAPKDGTRAIVYRPSTVVSPYRIALYENGVWTTTSGILPVQPTHWQPLPQPPKEP